MIPEPEWYARLMRGMSRVPWYAIRAVAWVYIVVLYARLGRWGWAVAIGMLEVAGQAVDWKDRRNRERTP